MVIVIIFTIFTGPMRPYVFFSMLQESICRSFFVANPVHLTLPFARFQASNRMPFITLIFIITAFKSLLPVCIYLRHVSIKYIVQVYKYYLELSYTHITNTLNGKNRIWQKTNLMHLCLEQACT